MAADELTCLPLEGLRPQNPLDRPAVLAEAVAAIRGHVDRLEADGALDDVMPQCLQVLDICAELESEDLPELTELGAAAADARYYGKIAFQQAGAQLTRSADVVQARVEALHDEYRALLAAAAGS